MLPNVYLPIRIASIRSFLEKRQTILAILFLFLSVFFSGFSILFSQKTEITQAHAVKRKPTPMPTRQPTPTLIPTKTPLPTAVPTRSANAGQENTPTPTVILPSAPQQTNGGAVPAKVLNLSNWKLTLPLGGSKKPTEITQPELAAYSNDPWFVVSGGVVHFRAPVNAVTTSGSNYPRSELREMKNGGKDRADWSSTKGAHTMTIDEAITAMPLRKPHVVAGQIHDADDDVIVIRLEGQNLYVNVDGKNLHTLDSAYTLGKRFTVRFDVGGGQTKVYYNGSEVYTLTKDYSGAYFKAGAYTQSNCSKEASDCNDSNYGEVVLYALSVGHQ